MIDSKVYEQLKKMKKDRSFSEIIRELINSRNTPPLSTLGVLKDEIDPLDFKELKKLRKEKNVSF